MRLFTWSYIFSASATRNFVHSVSTLFEIILHVLIGCNLSNIIFNKGETFEEEKRLKLAGTVDAVAFGLIGFAAVLAARLLSCIITTSIITRFNFNLLGMNVSQNTSNSLRATLGTIDARWMAIVVLGGLRGPGTYSENLSEIFSMNFVIFQWSASPMPSVLQWGVWRTSMWICSGRRSAS